MMAKLKWYMKTVSYSNSKWVIELHPLWVAKTKLIQSIKCFFGFHVWELDKYSICLCCSKQHDETFWYKVKRIFKK